MSSKIDLWDRRFLDLAKEISKWSKDNSTKVGSVIVGKKREIRSTGYNGFPRLLEETPDRQERPRKYLYTEHAERNAIYNASRIGIPLEGCILYSTLYPCADCARAVIQAGIKRIVSYEPNWDDLKWKEHFEAADMMMLEVGVEIRLYKRSET